MLKLTQRLKDGEMLTRISRTNMKIIEVYIYIYGVIK